MLQRAEIMFVIPNQRSTIKASSTFTTTFKTLLRRRPVAATRVKPEKNMSISSLFGSRINLAPNFCTKAAPIGGNYNVGLVIENSSRPKKKATAHHMKTRPRKTQAWDIRRKPTVYAPLPPLPPDWTLLSDDEAAADTGAAVPSSATLKAPLASG